MIMTRPVLACVAAVALVFIATPAHAGKDWGAPVQLECRAVVYPVHQKQLKGGHWALIDEGYYSCNRRADTFFGLLQIDRWYADDHEWRLWPPADLRQIPRKSDWRFNKADCVPGEYRSHYWLHWKWKDQDVTLDKIGPTLRATCDHQP